MPVFSSSLHNQADLLTSAAIKMAHVGQLLVDKGLAQFEQNIEKMERTSEFDEILDAKLEQAIELFELDIHATNPIHAIERLDAWLEENKGDPHPTLKGIRQRAIELKNYLLLVNALQKILNEPKQTATAAGDILEKELAAIFSDHPSIKQAEPLVTSAINTLLKCAQQLKLLEEMKNTPRKAPNKVEELKAFKLLKRTSYPLMSGAWLKYVIDNHLKNFPHQSYFKDNGSFTEKGSKRAERLIESVFSGQKELINQADLALIGVLFGKSLVKKILARYALKGEGTQAHPFTYSNLKILLLGIAANLTAEQIASLHPLAQAAIGRIQENFQNENQLASEDGLAKLIKEFEFGKQNACSSEPQQVLRVNIYRQLTAAMQKARKYLQNRLIAVVNVMDNEWLRENGSEYLSKIQAANLPLKHLTEDLELLKLQAKIGEYYIEKPDKDALSAKMRELFVDLEQMRFRRFCAKHQEFSVECLTSREVDSLENYRNLYIKNRGATTAELERLKLQVVDVFKSKCEPWSKTLNQLIGDLATIGFERFVTKYPCFSENNCSKQEFSQLQRFAALGSKVDDKLSLKVRQHLLNKINALYPFARATLFSHLLAYSSAIYTAEKNNTYLELPLLSGEKSAFNLKPIIRDEEGLAVTLLSPQATVCNEDGTIPLYLTLQGTHDILSAIRDLHPIGAGHEEFSHKKPYVKRILTAINQEITLLQARFPGKKISIEIFGHSLGGADSYQLLLALQEAMAQNKLNTPTGHQELTALCDSPTGGFQKAKDPTLRELLPEALKESVGLKIREFSATQHEDRRLALNHIEALKLDNIANIKVFAKNSAGCHQKVLASLAATAAYLGHNSHYQLFDYPVDIAGDAVQRTGHGRGLCMAHYQESFFKKCVKINHCKVDSKKAGLLNQGLHLLDGRCAPLEAHQAVIFEQGPVNWLQHSIKITSNSNTRNATAIKKEMSNSVKINGKEVIDMWAYRKLKAVIYACLSLTAMLLNPSFKYGQQLLQKIDRLQSKIAALFGILCANVESNSAEGKQWREAAIAKQKAYLFSYGRQTLRQSTNKGQSCNLAESEDDELGLRRLFN